MKNRIQMMYQNGQNGLEPSLTVDGVLKAATEGIISAEEAVEILGNDVEAIRAIKIKEISKACGKAIVNGVDIQFGEDTVHFNLSVEDQANIANLFKVVELGCTAYPYQSDGGVCRIYSAQEIAQIYLAAQQLITYNTTYHNTLKSYVQTLDDVEVLNTVTYGMELPEEYQAEMEAKLAVAQEQMTAVLERLGNAPDR